MKYSFKNYTSVIEFDFKLDTKATDLYTKLRFRFDGNDYAEFYLNSDGETYSIGTKDTASIDVGKWCNVRFELYSINESGKIVAKYAKVYINNEHTTTLTCANISSFNQRLFVYLEKNVTIDTTVVSIDNMFYAHIDKAYEQ